MLEKIDHVMAKFRVAMLKKFHKKETLGWTSWDNPDTKRILGTKLMEHTIKPFTRDNLVDIALLCLFLWNLEDE